MPPPSSLALYQYHADAANQAANQFQSAQARGAPAPYAHMHSLEISCRPDPTPRARERGYLVTWSSIMLTFRQEFVQKFNFIRSEKLSNSSCKYVHALRVLFLMRL